MALRLCLSFVLLFTGALVAPIAGCASAVQVGKSSALDATDLIAMTDDMAMKMTADPEIRAAIETTGPLRVVVQPVENQMTAEVLPRGPAETFTARLRALLSRHAKESFTWVMNRDAFYRLRGKELEVDLGPSPDAIDPEYALVARFSSITREDSKRRSSYYLCVYELTNLQTRDVLWSDKYEVKKQIVKGFLD